MASKSIPEEIKQYRPGPCTEIKFINGHYYVYMYQSIRLPSGRWGKKTGKSIGTIISGTGFIPNRNYHLYKGEESQDEITVLEYGQYALICAAAESILDSLKKFFPADRASQIFAYASILYANGFVHLDQVQSYYEQSWLSQEYKNLPFKMGKTALGTLLDDLGRRTTRVIHYENAAITDSSSAIAIDGHAIRSCSDENDLGGAGYKFCSLKEDQVNLLMGYDVNTGAPLFARMYRGACNDKSAIEDITDLLEFSGILFVIDRGFYSTRNLKILSANDNTYIIPVPSNTDVFRDAMKDVKYTDSFYYRSGYTPEKLEQNKETFGVYVLQSNAAKTAEEVFAGCKRRWGIETFYQYLKNIGGFNDLMIQDYYKEQGFSFIMLITGQIHQKMISAVKKLDDNTLSVHDVLLMARCLKMERRGNNWNLKNARKRDLQILKKLCFEPKLMIPD